LLFVKEIPVNAGGEAGEWRKRKKKFYSRISGEKKERRDLSDHEKRNATTPTS